MPIAIRVRSAAGTYVRQSGQTNADIAGRIQVFRLTATTNGAPWTHIVRFLADGDDGTCPHRQLFWGRKAVDTMLRQLGLDPAERASVHAELENDGVSAVIQKTLSARLLKRLGLHRNEVDGVTPPPPRRHVQPTLRIVPR